MRFRAVYLMNLCLMALALGAFIMALEWPLQASLFPLVIAVPVFFMALGDLVLDLTEGTKQEKKSVIDFKFSEESDQALALRRTLFTAGWIIAFFLLILLLGFPAAIPIFVFCYLKFQAKESWRLSFIITASVWGVFGGLFIGVLHTRFPRGWLVVGLKALGIG